MRKTLALILALIMLILAVGCSRQDGQTYESDTDVTAETGAEETKPDESSEREEPILPPEKDTLAPKTENDPADHSVFLALYFHEPITDPSSFGDNAHLYEFLVNYIYDLYTDNVVPLENISDKDWFPQYLIPTAYMEKAASLLFGLDELPERFFSDDSGFQEYEGYQKEYDAFLFTPYEHPYFHTECKSIWQSDDGYTNTVVTLWDVGEKWSGTFVYTFEVLDDDEWGVTYRVLSIRDSVTVTVDSIDRLREMTEGGCLGYHEDFYDYFYRFFVDGWDFPEVNDVEFSDISFTFSIPFDNMKGIEYSFTVAESDLEGLKPGTYRKKLADGKYDFFVTDLDNPPDYSKFRDIPEVDKLWFFIVLNRIWNTPTYAKGTTYPGAYDYIHYKYGDSNNHYSKLDYESICKYAKEEFGVTEPEKMYIINNTLPDDEYWPCADKYPSMEIEITDVTKTADGCEVTVQTYADPERYICSHKILYHFDGDGHFNGYTVLKEGRYGPRGLGYIEDDGTLAVHWLQNLAYYTEHGVFSQNQYDYYKGFLNNGVTRIYDFLIRFSPMTDGVSFESTIDFTVAHSSLETLPVGDYHRKVIGVVSLSVEDAEQTVPPQ